MRAAQHTPGPWAAVPAANGSGDFGILADGHGPLPRVVIAEVFSSIDFDGQRAMVAPGNAELIAAAPDLLEKARSMFSFIEEAARAGILDATEVSQQFGDVRALIAKATGSAA